jgi:hypothetical protein
LICSIEIHWKTIYLLYNIKFTMLCWTSIVYYLNFDWISSIWLKSILVLF